MTTQNRLDEIRERLENATPGPWNHEPERYSAKNVIGIKPRDDRWLGYCQPEMNGYANAELIANAPTDIAFLLSTISRQYEAIKTLKTAIRVHHDNWAQANNDNLCLAECRRTCAALAKVEEILKFEQAVKEK